jgi:hypothetical protein
MFSALVFLRRLSNNQRMVSKPAAARSVTAPSAWPSGALPSALYIAGSLLVLVIFLIKPGINHYPPSLFDKTIDGTAHKPYVLRALVPVTIRVVAMVVPESIHSSLTEAAKASPLREVLTTLDKIPPELCTEFLIAFLFMLGALLAFLLVLRDLFETLFESPREFAWKVPLMALLLLPPFFRYTSFVYDFPAVFFFTFGLSLMFRRQWTAYLVVFLLSCLNKETTILLTMVFWLNFRGGEIPDRQFRGLLLSQIGAFILTKAALGYVYRGNEGGTLEFHLIDHNIDLLQPYDPSVGIAYLVLFLLLTYRWSEKPLFLRRALWIAAPLFGLTVFLGYFDELRDYYELFPIMLLLVAHSFGNMIGLDVTTRSRLPASAPSSLRQVPQLTAVAAVAGALVLAAVSVTTTLVKAESSRRIAPTPKPAPMTVESAKRSAALSAAAHDAFVAELSRETPSSAWIEYDARDTGARDLAEALGAAFEEAHWKVRMLQPATFPLRTGVYLLVAEKISRTTEAVSRALVSANVHHTEAEDYRAYGDRRQREVPDWKGPTFAQDQEFLLVVGRSDSQG